MSNELDTFIDTWNAEAEKTASLIESLPHDQFDFRPDPGGRSLGELAWHLAEVEGYITDGIVRRNVDFAAVPGLNRPHEVAALVAGFRKAHEDAVARLRKLKPSDLDQMVHFAAAARTLTVRDLLWRSLLHHGIHHRGQLALLNRLAGGVTPGIYGPNREETAAMREQAQR